MTKGQTPPPRLQIQLKTETFTKIGEIGGFDIKARVETTYANKGGVMESAGSHPVIKLANHGSYSVEASIKSMENFIQKRIETNLAKYESDITQKKEKLSEVTKNLAKPFEKKSEIEAAVKKLAELDEKIRGNDNAPNITSENSRSEQESFEKARKEPTPKVKLTDEEKIEINTSSELLAAIKKESSLNLTNKIPVGSPYIAFTDFRGNVEKWTASNLKTAIAGARYLVKHYPDFIAEDEQ